MNGILQGFNWWEIAAIPLIMTIGFALIVIFISFLVAIILRYDGYNTEKIAGFWLKVLMIIFRYKEDSNDGRNKKR